MISELKEFENVFAQYNIGIVSNLLLDKEAKAYCGYNFQINQFRCKFRKTKITPKKIGQFVTLWRRNEEGITEPFSENSDVYFYIVFTEEGDRRGIFLFSKTVLIQKQILSTSTKEVFEFTRFGLTPQTYKRKTPNLGNQNILLN